MNNAPINVKDPRVVRQIGVDALLKSLGPVGMINFFHQFDTGSGNYTKERLEINGDIAVDDIYNEIVANRENTL
ncbi:MAG: hypothetical protein LBS74_08385 [Oscillospiraceae bacterium]|jgi:hypothetical protein|nr:hypothetical protein [Oscillospiraceae bacterium]